MKSLSVKFLVLYINIAMVFSCDFISYAGDSLYGINRFVASNSSSEPALSAPSPAETPKLSRTNEYGTTVTATGTPAVFDRVVLTEDTTLQGRVLIRGYLVVAPQATLRIEPGTVVMFDGSGVKKQNSQLVVQGRISALGTISSPILLTSGRSRPSRGDWGGISFVSTEKRNQLEHCRIEYATYGVSAQFSSVSFKMVSILNSSTALLARDSVLQIYGGAFAESDNGMEITDSELDLKDSIVNANNRGMLIKRSAANLSSPNIKDNRQYGVLAEVSRIKLSTGEISGNAVGSRFVGGEGQITGTVFKNNRETALHVSGARIKVSRNLFVKNRQDAIRTEDGLALIWGNSFSANSGYNIYNSGADNINAFMNWWETTDPVEISLKIFDSERDPRFGSVQFFPWMNEKPAYAQ